MKKLIGLGIVAITVACIPYITGIMTEKQYLADMQEMQNSPTLHSVPFDLKINVSYQRGWFSSTAVNAITLTLADQKPVTVKVNNHISHGPVLFNGPKRFGLAAIETQVPLSEGQQAEIAKIWKSDEKPVQIHSHIGFSGDSTIEASIAGFTLENIDGKPSDAVTFEPFEMTVAFADNLSRFNANFDWNGLQVNAKDLNIFVGKVTARSEKYRLLEDLWLGDDEVKFGVLKFKLDKLSTDPLVESPSSVTLEELAVVAHSEVDNNNLVRGDTTLIVKNAMAENLPVASDIKLTVALENMPAQALQSVSRKLSDYQNQVIQSANPEQLPDFSEYQEDLEQILAANPVLKIPAAQANTQQGRVEADLEVSINEANTSMLQNPILLLGVVEVSANVNIPAKLIAETPLAEQIPILVSQGYIIDDHGQLKSAIQFQQGELTVNGKTM